MGENRGSGHRILTPNKSFLTFWAPNFYAKFHQNRTKIAAVWSAERQTDRQKDASDFIICPMLCYSNRTDNNKVKLLRTGADVQDDQISASLAAGRTTLFSNVHDSR